MIDKISFDELRNNRWQECLEICVNKINEMIDVLNVLAAVAEVVNAQLDNPKG